jgi:LPXTG-motif cell wall-anchored protein
MMPGDAAVFSTDTKLYAVWKTHYKVIEGGGSSWVKGSGKKQRFVANGNKAYFTEFRIDEKRFTDGVEITSGSTVADIKAWAMEKLSAGTHTVTFVYKDGKASAKFFVEPKKIPKTGDSSNPALWIGMIILGLLGIGGLIFRTARKRR